MKRLFLVILILLIFTNLTARPGYCSWAVGDCAIATYQDPNGWWCATIMCLDGTIGNYEGGGFINTPCLTVTKINLSNDN